MLVCVFVYTCVCVHVCVYAFVCVCVYVYAVRVCLEGSNVANSCPRECCQVHRVIDCGERVASRWLCDWICARGLGNHPQVSTSISALLAWACGADVRAQDRVGLG